MYFYYFIGNHCYVKNHAQPFPKTKVYNKLKLYTKFKLIGPIGIHFVCEVFDFECSIE